MAINDIVLRTAKELYEKRAFDAGKKQLWEFLFPNENTDTSAGFSLDKLIHNAYGIRYTVGQSAVRAYQPGTSTVIVPPRASEKTPLTGDLLDAVVRGSEAVESFDANKTQLVANVVGDHYDAFTMTKNYQALQVMGTGIFEAKGEAGADLDLSINYGRAAGNSLTFDFTDGDPTFSQSINEAMQKLIDNGAAQIMAIAGKNWRAKWSGDADVLQYMKANAVNQIVTQQMIEEINGVEGLYALGQFRAPDLAVPVMLAQYQPGTQYVAYEGADAAPFVADDEIIFFGMGAPRYSVNRRIDTIVDGELSYDAGPLVVDRFPETDPAGEFLRTQSRHAFVPADVNQTVKVTGTFA